MGTTPANAALVGTLLSVEADLANQCESAMLQRHRLVVTALCGGSGAEILALAACCESLAATLITRGGHADDDDDDCKEGGREGGPVSGDACVEGKSRTVPDDDEHGGPSPLFALHVDVIDDGDAWGAVLRDVTSAVAQKCRFVNVTSTFHHVNMLDKAAFEEAATRTVANADIVSLVCVVLPSIIHFIIYSDSCESKSSCR